MLHVRPLTTADVPWALGLCRQAGWNQTAADWRRFLNLQPDGCFLAERDGVPVGTTTTTIFGHIGWIAMVLVEHSARGRGIGTALVGRALQLLEERGVVTIRLDATPLGQPLYERLGFIKQFELARHEGTVVAGTVSAAASVALPVHLGTLASLDEAVTGTDRRRLLQGFFEDDPEAMRCVWQGGRMVGFMASRPGFRAVQVGPCIATPEAGPVLLADAWQRHAGQHVFVDIPVDNEPASKLAQRAGLTVQRHLTRMCRGIPVCERVAWLWASSGPENG